MHTLPCNNFHTFVSRPISPICATKHDTRHLAIITGHKGSPSSLRVGHETRKRLAWPVNSIFPLCLYLDELPPSLATPYDETQTIPANLTDNDYKHTHLRVPRSVLFWNPSGLLLITTLFIL